MTARSAAVQPVVVTRYTTAASGTSAATTTVVYGRIRPSPASPGGAPATVPAATVPTATVPAATAAATAADLAALAVRKAMTASAANSPRNTRPWRLAGPAPASQ